MCLSFVWDDGPPSTWMKSKRIAALWQLNFPQELSVTVSSSTKWLDLQKDQIVSSLSVIHTVCQQNPDRHLNPHQIIKVPKKSTFGYPALLCADWSRRLMWMEIFSEAESGFSGIVHTVCGLLSVLETIHWIPIWLCLCGYSGIAVLHCTHLLHYLGGCERADYSIVIHVCWGSAGTWPLPAYRPWLRVIAEAHNAVFKAGLVKYWTQHSAWQRDILTKGTTARAKLCIVIFLLFIFRFWEVLKCISTILYVCYSW